MRFVSLMTLALEGAESPLAFAVRSACPRLVGQQRCGNGHFVDEGLAVGVINANPVLLTGNECETRMERTEVWLAVGEEHHMLALGYLRVDVA